MKHDLEKKDKDRLFIAWMLDKQKIRVAKK